MPRKASYPDWVTKHVKKGQYINKINGNYYLYEAHSERKEGVSHPVRVCDGYVGRITQEDGLIPSKKRTQQSEKAVLLPQSSLPKSNAWVFGTHYAVFKCSQSILEGLKRSYSENAPLIYVISILEFLYGISNQSLYEMSVLSFVYPELKISNGSSTPELRSAVERGKRMISDTINREYGDDWPLLQAYLSSSVIIKSTRGYKATDIQAYAVVLFQKYKLQLNTTTFETLINREA